MTDHTLIRPAVAALAVVLLGLLVACGDSGAPVAPDPDHAAVEVTDRARSARPAIAAGPGNADVARDLAALRRATSRFHRPEAAAEAGYTALVTHPTSGDACLADPTEGGMGRHMLNPGLYGDTTVVVTEPEVLIYEPMRNGKLRLVGVEYIINWDNHGPDEPAPTLFGREFLPNPTFNLWMLHVYTWKHNPDGMFATWNPAITCKHDGEV